MHTHPLDTGTFVRVPFGKNEVLGVVWADGSKEVNQFNQKIETEQVAPTILTEPTPKSSKLVLKPISSVIEGIKPLDKQWLALIEFAAGYYQRSLGEMALQALPPQLRD